VGTSYSSQSQVLSPSKAREETSNEKSTLVLHQHVHEKHTCFLNKNKTPFKVITKTSLNSVTRLFTTT
jgi:hypothetical protein